MRRRRTARRVAQRFAQAFPSSTVMWHVSKWSIDIYVMGKPDLSNITIPGKEWVR